MFVGDRGGAIGLMASRLDGQLGDSLTTFCDGSDATGRSWPKKMGADDALDPSGSATWCSHVIDCDGGAGVDVCFRMSGHLMRFIKVQNAAAGAGRRVSLLGIPKDPV